MKLERIDYGRSDKVHFNRANAALDRMIQADAVFAAQMEKLIPGVANMVSTVKGRTTPKDFTWHHDKADGIMQLVPSDQHRKGSIFYQTFHENGKGGYFIWAIPAGAPERRRK